MKFQTLAGVIITSILTTPAMADEYQTAGGYPACVSEELFQEAIKALSANDEQWFKSLNGCIITKSGIKLGVIDRGFGTSKVRLFTSDGESLVMWTNSENIVSR